MRKAGRSFAMGLVLVEFNHHVATPYLKGIDPAREVTVSRLKEYMHEGKLDLTGETVVIGQELALQYGIFSRRQDHGLLALCNIEEERRGGLSARGTSP